MNEMRTSSDTQKLLPWIGGATRSFPDAGFSPIVSPNDETVVSQIVESDAKVIDAAVKDAHAALREA